MMYYKTSQPVPGKGDAWMFYECGDDESVRRYLTYIPMTGEVDRVPKPFIKKLQRPEMLMPATRDEFYRYWGDDSAELYPTGQQIVSEELKARGVSARKHFDPDMTIEEAMAVHPQVGEVFAAFHLGGCSNCGIAEYETVGQVCIAYGVDVDVLFDVLEGLVEESEAEQANEAPVAATL